LAITDDDTAGVEVRPQQLTVAEGEAITYTVRLTSEPLVTVTIGLRFGAGLDSVTPSQITFTPSDWSQPATITITASENFVDAENPPVAIIHRAGSDDENYAGIEESVTVTITDDDEAGVLVVPPTSPIIEGATITYTLHLT